MLCTMHIELKWKLPYILYRYTFTVRHPKPYSKYSGLCPAEQDGSATVEVCRNMRVRHDQVRMSWCGYTSVS